MPTFHYRALSQVGEIVSGSIAAPTAAEVGRRIEYLGLIPIDSVTEESGALIKRAGRIRAFFAAASGRRHHLHRRSGLAAAHRALESTRRWSCSPPTSDIGRMRSTATKVTVGDSLGRELRRRDLAPSERLSPDLRRARPRGRGVGQFGADPRGDQRGAPARRGVAPAPVRHFAIPGFPADRRPAACCCSSSWSFCRNSRMSSKTSTRNWIRFW